MSEKPTGRPHGYGHGTEKQSEIKLTVTVENLTVPLLTHTKYAVMQ